MSLFDGSRVIGEETGLQIEIESPIPLDPGCIIHLSLPTDFTGLQKLMHSVTAFGMFGHLRDVDFQVLPEPETKNLVEIRGACESHASNALKGTINLRYVRNPETVRDTGPLTVKFFDSELTLLAETKSTNATAFVEAAQFRAGPLSNFTVNGTDRTV